jgi:hypothetical protein
MPTSEIDIKAMFDKLTNSIDAMGTQMREMEERLTENTHNMDVRLTGQIDEVRTLVRRVELQQVQIIMGHNGP